MFYFYIFFIQYDCCFTLREKSAIAKTLEKKSNKLVTPNLLYQFKGRRVDPYNEFPMTGNPFPPCNPCSRWGILSQQWNGEGNGVIGKRAKVGWLVSRPGFRRKQDGERAKGCRCKGKSEEDEEISRRSSLYPRDLKPNGGGRSLKKRIYNLLLAGAT